MDDDDDDNDSDDGDTCTSGIKAKSHLPSVSSLCGSTPASYSTSSGRWLLRICRALNTKSVVRCRDHAGAQDEVVRATIRPDAVPMRVLLLALSAGASIQPDAEPARVLSPASRKREAAS